MSVGYVCLTMTRDGPCVVKTMDPNESMDDSEGPWCIFSWLALAVSTFGWFQVGKQFGGDE